MRGSSAQNSQTHDLWIDALEEIGRTPKKLLQKANAAAAAAAAARPAVEPDRGLGTPRQPTKRHTRASRQTEEITRSVAVQVGEPAPQAPIPAKRLPPPEEVAGSLSPQAMHATDVASGARVLAASSRKWNSSRSPSPTHRRSPSPQHTTTPGSPSSPVRPRSPSLASPMRTPSLHTPAPAWSQRSAESGKVTEGSPSSRTPRHVLSTDRVSDLPWNQPKLPPEEHEPNVFASIGKWFGELFSSPKPAKRRSRRADEPDDRPPWHTSVDYAPLTGSADPPAIAFHRKLVKPWEPPETEAWWRTPRDEVYDERVRMLNTIAKAPKSQRRATQIRDADVFNRIEHFDAGVAAKRDPSAGNEELLGGYISEGSYRLPAAAGWISSQAWAENLRYYPGQEEAEANGESVLALSGRTHSTREVPSQHLETDVRRRTGGALADPAWRPEQTHHTWAPNMVRKSMQRQLDRTVERMLKAETKAKAPRSSKGPSRTIAGYSPPPRPRDARAAASASAAGSSPSRVSRGGRRPKEVRL